jgi:hypothetical protein
VIWRGGKEGQFPPPQLLFYLKKIGGLLRRRGVNRIRVTVAERGGCVG